MAARDVMVHIPCDGSSDCGVQVRARGEGKVWLRLVDPDGDGEVSIDREKLEDAIAYVVGAGPGEWLEEHER